MMNNTNTHPQTGKKDNTKKRYENEFGKPFLLHDFHHTTFNTNLTEERNGQSKQIIDWRSTALDRTYPIGIASSGSMGIPPGEYGPWKGAIRKNEIGEIVIHESMEAADVATFLLTLAHSNPLITDMEKYGLAIYIDHMNNRAQRRNPDVQPTLVSRLIEISGSREKTTEKES